MGLEGHIGKAVPPSAEPGDSMRGTCHAATCAPPAARGERRTGAPTCPRTLRHRVLARHGTPMCVCRRRDFRGEGGAQGAAAVRAAPCALKRVVADAASRRAAPPPLPAQASTRLRRCSAAPWTAPRASTICRLTPRTRCVRRGAGLLGTRLLGGVPSQLSPSLVLGRQEIWLLACLLATPWAAARAEGAPIPHAPAACAMVARAHLLSRHAVRVH